MPVYEYQCQDCGFISEKLLMGGESTEDINCGRCNSVSVDRILSAASFLSKGSPFKHGHTCCGQEERCDSPPCSSGSSCRRA